MDLEGKNRIVLVMKQHQQCPVFNDGGTMVLEWPRIVPAESTNFCLEALSSFLTQVKKSKDPNPPGFTCSLGSCNGVWVIKEIEKTAPYEPANDIPTIAKPDEPFSSNPQRREPFLSTVPPYIINSLIHFAKSNCYEKGELVLKQGIYTGIFYIVMEGSVEVFQSDPHKETGSDVEVIIGELGQKECFGEMSLLTGDPTSASVRAKLPSKILSISENDFFAFIQLNPKFSLYLTRLLANKILQANTQLRHVFDEGMIGRISMVPIFDIVQNLHHLRRTGLVELRKEGTQACFGLLKGEVIYAKSDTLEGEEAFYHLISWKKGTFVLKNEINLAKRNINRGTIELLLEGVRRIDQGEKQDR